MFKYSNTVFDFRKMSDSCSSTFSLRKQPPHIGRLWFESRPMWGGCFRRLGLISKANYVHSDPVIVNKLHRKKVVGTWSVSGR